MFGIFLLAFFFAQAQDETTDTLNRIDRQGLKQGYWKSVDADGKLKFEGRFIDDHPAGTFRYYYPDGKLKAISVMRDQGNSARTRLFHENGRLMGEGNYRNKVKDSTWSYYSDLDGSLVSRETYVEGELDGIVYNYFPEGGIAEEIPYKGGLKEGTWKRYFPDGTIKLKASYTGDKLEGMMVVYYESGIPQISGMYRHNLKEGPWMHFSEQGAKLKKETYKYGHLKETEEY